MKQQLVLRNRQRARPINTWFLRRVASALLEEEFGLECYELAVHLVEPARMAALNWQFLGHKGSTDVISFDLREGYGDAEYQELPLAGEIFISVQDAVIQARQFEVPWQEEVIRYLIHGVLHLRGFDDLSARDRKLMKREENRLLRKMASWFDFKRLRPKSSK